MSNKPNQAADTILGYTLVERVGSGGYGEVWSAIAPGGLQKAVKFVYGYHDEKRAQTEIKALDRVKELRHPFLLSLERIDIVDGQLVIISELADGCLADVFNQYVKKGESGIPREELLAYIRDAADALDYLAQNHSLQHLDIKPENLLLVGGHVKVADFGLVKELGVSEQSLMTGMTPAYAAPELFDGRPGDRSDQYSLAIVYQEMLTSVRPFPGTTPAQLAAQHMHGRPNLRSLPSSDQAVLAKALSKDPSVRFRSCREMVDELTKKRVRKKTIRRLDGAGPRDLPNPTNTMPLQEANRDVTAVVSSTCLPFQASDLEKLGPPELAAEPTELQPTIVVAVGNMATRTAATFKQRIQARHGSIHEVPAVKIVCIDTDRTSMSMLASPHQGCRMEESELLPTPLAKPEHYRERANSHLNWLSRRWIYNIPRSLQTEGLRPLGRLAFAEHFDAIYQRLSRAIEEATRAENLAETAEAAGIAPATSIQPRVVLIGSISGGVGGMLFDIAYTIRTILSEQGFDSSRLHALAMHSVNRRSREPGLSAANAFTFLTEFRHFTEFGYPGDDSIGLPEFPETPPFDDIYYLDLGADLKSTALDEKIESISEWVYLNSLSNCAKFFDACRELTRESEHFDLRSFGLSISGQGKSNAGMGQANELAMKLVDQWISGQSADPSYAARQVAQFFDETELHCDGVMNVLDQELHELIPDATYQELIESSRRAILTTSASGNATSTIEALSAQYDYVFGIPSHQQEVGYQAPELVSQFDERVEQLALEFGSDLSAQIMALFDGEQLNLAVAYYYLQECRNRFEDLKSKLDDAGRGCDGKIKEVESFLSELMTSKRTKKDQDEALDQCLESYRLFRWQEFLLRNARSFIAVMQKSLTAPRNLVDKARETLDALKGELGRQNEPMIAADDHGFQLERLMLDKINSSSSHLMERIELQLFQDVIANGGFLRWLQDPFRITTEFPEKMREVAIQILTDAYKKLTIDELIAESEAPREEIFTWLNTQLGEAFPEVRNCGGGARLIMALPQFSGKSELPEVLNQQFGADAIHVNGTAGDMVLCYEAEAIALAAVAFRLLELRPDAAQLSKRIHTRNDIEWTSLEDLM